MYYLHFIMNRRAFFERNLVEERKQYMSMYKAKSFGERDRVKNSNANSAKENRKRRRDEEISKRRMPLCTIETKNITVNDQIEEKSTGRIIHDPWVLVLYFHD